MRYCIGLVRGLRGDEQFCLVFAKEMLRQVTIEETTERKKYTETKLWSSSVALAWLWDLQNHQASLRLLFILG